MIDVQLMGLLNATLQAATLLFIAALGELITEKSGILNLGVEGMISVGAVSGFITAINTESLFLAVIVGVLSASAFSSIHAFVTVVLKTGSNSVWINFNYPWTFSFFFDRKTICWKKLEVKLRKPY